jgi:hypothetical protein
MRQITTAAEDAGHVFVSKGLNANEAVVSEGALVLESLLDANTSTANASAEKPEH